MKTWRPFTPGLLVVGLACAIPAQFKRIQIPADEKRILSQVDLSGFYALLRKGKIKDATALIDRLQLIYPKEQEVERNFIMLFICQERDEEVLSRASEYAEMPQIVEWLDIPKAKLNLNKAGANRLHQIYSRTLISSNSNEWVKYGFLDRVLRDDPTNPEGICVLFGTMPHAECISKMRSFDLARLEAAALRGNPGSSKLVLNRLVQIKKWMTKNPDGVPYIWRDSQPS